MLSEKLLASHKLRTLMSGKEALQLVEIIHDCVVCQDEERFRTIISSLQRLLAFNSAWAGLGRRNHQGKVVFSVPFNISLPEAMLRLYRSEGFVQRDPVIRRGFTGQAIQYWDGLSRSYQVPALKAKAPLDMPKEMLSLFMDFRLRGGYAYAATTSARGQEEGCFFCFLGKRMIYEPRAAVLLELLGPHLHQALSRLSLARQPDVNTQAISLRERDVLDWLKRGKSSWDIAAILGIGERTVNYHIYNAVRKLGAINRTQAVALAIRQGLIAPE